MKPKTVAMDWAHKDEKVRFCFEGRVYEKKFAKELKAEDVVYVENIPYKEARKLLDKGVIFYRCPGKAVARTLEE